MFLWSLFAILIIIFDQLTKILVVQNITLNSGDVLVIPEMFSFVHVHNPGAAFSILQGKIELLSCISLAFCVGVIWYMLIRKPQNKVLRISTMLLFAGAIGNVIDRIFRGYVVDFIKVLFINFPVFNLADIAITCGAALLIIYILFLDNKKE